MMEAKFTPGPWVMETRKDLRDNPCGFLVTGRNTNSKNGVNVLFYTPDGSNAEKKANATLIAAAPDLLEALKNADRLITMLMPGIAYIVLQDYGFLNATLLANTAAIAKAEGEGK